MKREKKVILFKKKNPEAAGPRSSFKNNIFIYGFIKKLTVWLPCFL